MTKIQSVVDDLENLNVLNDELYSELKSKNFLKRGYSINKIRMHLINKGINDKLLKETIQKITNDDDNPDFTQQSEYVKSEELGHTDQRQIELFFTRKI